MLEKISFRHKLFILPVACIIAMVASISIIVKYNLGVNRKIDNLSQNSLPAWEMNRALRKTLRSTQDAVLKAFTAGSPAELKNAEAERTRFLEQVEAQKDNPLFDGQRYQSVKQLYQDYYSTALSEFTRQLKRETGARAKMDTTVTAPKYNELRTRIDAITLDSEKEIKAGLVTLRKTNQNQIFFLLLVAGFSFFMIVGLTFTINPTYLRPLKIATDVADMVARGDLTVRVPSYEGSDEMCNLLRVFRTMVENLRTLTEQIKEAVSALASAAT
jgi:nitrogen fixation/metabolism regulation signal transduction histidine kinase